jgi:hypothetical protein
MKSKRLDVRRLLGWQLCAFLLISWPSTLFAQGPGDNVNDFLELAASEIRDKTKEIIGGSMNFSEEEGKAFWPLYEKYEDESGKITDEMIALLKDYEANIANLSDAKSKELADKVFDIDERKVRLNRKYYTEFCKVLPPTRVLQFFQLMRRIDTLVNLRIASVMPMIGEDW